MESGEITDSQVYSSSNMGSLSVASNARLNLQLMSPSGVGAWCAPAQSEDNWFTVHLVTSHVISAVSHMESAAIRDEKYLVVLLHF